MTTILVTKGSHVFTRPGAGGDRALREQPETEGLLTHLVEETDYRVVYYGKWKGPSMEGVEVVQPCLEESDGDSLGHDSPPKEQQRCWDIDFEQLRPMDPVLMLHVAGYASGRCNLGNGVGLTLQDCSVRYLAPQVHCLHALGIPRIVINSDVLTHPREQEMSREWPEAVPIAVLDQQDKDYKRKVGPRTYWVGARYAGVENWSTMQRAEPYITAHQMVIAAHAHVKDGKRNKTIRGAWSQLLGDNTSFELFMRKYDLHIFGRSWDWLEEVYGPHARVVWKGPISQSDVCRELAGACCGPIVSHTPGFATSKARFYLMQDCAPIFFGDGEHPNTYDGDERILDLGSSMRVVDEDGLEKMLEYLQNPRNLTTYLEMLKLATMPNYDLLDECIAEAIRRGCAVTLPEDKAWFEQFGGYRGI